MHSDLALASLPSFLTQIHCLFFPLLLHFFLSTSVFSRVTSFICVWLQLLSILSLSALLPSPRWTCWYTVELSALTEDEKKKKSTLERKKRPRPEDYWRPFSLLVQRQLHQTNANLIFSEGVSDSSSEGVNVPQIDSLNDGGPCVVPTNHFRQQWKCY